MKLKVIELFGGIGACTAALKRLGIDYEVVDYVEIDKYAVKSYNAMNGTNFEPQDVSTWDKDIKGVDLIMHGSPCQDFSIAGDNAGGDEGSGTRSSLMWETIRIVEKLKPKYVLWENVKNMLSKKHRHNFDEYLLRMKLLGYTNYWQVLDAQDYGIPQHRERVFTVSIRNYKFPAKQQLNTVMRDYMEENVDEKYYLSDKMLQYFITNNEKQKSLGNGFRFEPTDGGAQRQASAQRQTDGVTTTSSVTGGASPRQSELRQEQGSMTTSSRMEIKTNNSKGYIIAEPGDSLTMTYPNSTTRRGRVGKQVCQTLDTGCNVGVFEE